MNCVAVHIVDSYSPRIDCVDPCLQKDATYKENEKELTTLTLLCAESYGTILRKLLLHVRGEPRCPWDERIHMPFCKGHKDKYSAFDLSSYLCSTAI